MDYEAVVFDLFGTLTPDVIERDRVPMLTAMADALEVPVDQFRERWDAGSMDRMRGGSLAEHVAMACRDLGNTPAPQQVQEALDRRLAWSRSYFFDTLQSIVQTVKVIREHKELRLALVSVCMEEVPGLWKECPLAPYFDVTVFSCEVGLMKPDPGIYLLASDGLGVPPEACLYIGDGSFGELHGAEEAGMTAALFRRPDQDPDVHRPGERDDWTGEVISAIPEVLRLLC
ncbi:MAG: HAD family hydrolase [Actinomycetota bacterium]